MALASFAVKPTAILDYFHGTVATLYTSAQAIALRDYRDAHFAAERVKDGVLFLPHYNFPLYFHDRFLVENAFGVNPKGDTAVA